jgi:hypothetical protein
MTFFFGSRLTRHVQQLAFEDWQCLLACIPDDLVFKCSGCAVNRVPVLLLATTCGIL